MKLISLPLAKSLLEKYVQAKDNNRPELIDEAFATDAVLTFSIQTDTINFPQRSEGTADIARTLVSDFAKTFSRCRTYYVSDKLAFENNAMNTMTIPWFVAMRESATDTMRAGKGFYRWGFCTARDESWRIAMLHIHIERMDSIPDAEAISLQSLHAALDYPWLTADALKLALDELIVEQPGLACMQIFSEPVPLP
ncbi:hypothetical protein [Burkholderia pyrrocinia]|uniref:hypothetical protein n=1 Tax=Burkholderia pyrrocinia TaxID=60550 RepID=UPI002AB0E9B1|nr:hypothetical protein [Burkholderia pyrrocinia]